MIKDKQKKVPFPDWNKIFPEKEIIDQAHKITLGVWVNNLAPKTAEEKVTYQYIEEKYENR